MTLFEEILSKDASLIVQAHEDIFRLFTAEEHEIIDAIIAMGEE